MSRIFKSEKGVITVFVSTLLVSVLSFGTLIIESGRLHSARAQLDEVGISSATSVLSNYDLNLYQRYGILAYTLDDDTRSRFQDDITFDSDLDSDYYGNGVTRLYSLNDTNVTGFYNLTYPSVLKRQILSKSKYLRSSYAFSMNFDNAGQVIADFSAKADRAQALIRQASSQSVGAAYRSALAHLEQAYIDLKLFDEGNQAVLSGAVTGILPSHTGIVKDRVPPEEVAAIQATLDDAKRVVPQYASYIGGISSINDDTESTAAVRINAANIRKQMKDATNGSSIAALVSTALNTVTSMKNTFGQLTKNGEQEKNLLLNSYIAKHCANRVYIPEGFAGAADSKATDNFVKCYAEYIYGGKAAEADNQLDAYWLIFYYRLCDNLNCMAQHYSSYGNAAEKVLWAYYESLVDMTLLTDYCTSAVVPLTKNELFLPINSPTSLNSISRVSDIKTSIQGFHRMNRSVKMAVNGVERTCSSCAGSNYAAYSDYISITLWFVSNADKLTRLSDLIQLETRYRQRHINGETVTFRSQNCYTYCKVETNARFSTLLPVISIDSQGDPFAQVPLHSVKYVGF